MAVAHAVRAHGTIYEVYEKKPSFDKSHSSVRSSALRISNTYGRRQRAGGAG